MFDVGFLEILVMLVVAVFVFGPDKLPEFGRQLGRFVRHFRQMSRTVQSEVRTGLGPDFDDFQLRDLNPRQMLQGAIGASLASDPASERGPEDGRPDR